MKIFRFLTLSLFCVTISLQVFAQDADCVSNEVIINKFGDNTFGGVSAGISTLLSKGNTPCVAPDLEVYFGKWFTPGFGTRLSYQGLYLKEYYSGDFRHHYPAQTIEDFPGKPLITYGFSYFHADAMWNLTNSFSRTKNSRFTAAPYWHVGLVHLYDMNEGFFSESQDNEFAMGPGLYLGYGLSNALDLTFDVRDVIYSGRFHNWSTGGPVNTLTASVGLAVKFGKTDWDKGVSETCYNDAMEALKEARLALDAANAALLAAKDENDRLLTEKDENARLKSKIASLNMELDSLSNIEKAKKATWKGSSIFVPYVVCYEIGKDKLSEKETGLLNGYIKEILYNDEAFIFHLTGSADKGTGAFNYNLKLAQRRVLGIKNILMSKYGIPENNIIIQDVKVSENHKNQPWLDRSVTISR